MRRDNGLGREEEEKKRRGIRIGIRIEEYSIRYNNV